MGLELIRLRNSRYWVIVPGVVSLCVVLGYVLLAGVDHEISIDAKKMFESVYTVFTQFGLLFFSPIVIYTFSNDYKEQNILFYKMSGCSSVKYFINKLSALAIYFVCAITGIVIITSAVLRDYSLTVIMILYLSCVTLFYLTVSCMWAYICKNFMTGFFVNLVIWLFTIVVAQSNKRLYMVAFYDSSSKVHKTFINLLNDSRYVKLMPLCVESIIYDVIVVGIALLIAELFKNRWKKNGI